jgi:hypothetical protein
MNNQPLEPVSAESDSAQTHNGTHGSLYARLRAAGALDGAMVLLEEARPLKAIVELAAKHGIHASISSAHNLKRTHLHQWQAEKVRTAAAAEGIHERYLPAVVREVLLAKIGRNAMDAANLDQLKTVTGIFADWSRVSIAERAEERAAVNDQRKLISDLTKAASRVYDLLGNDDEVRRLREVVDAEKGVSRQVNAIIHALWGDLFSVAEEGAA